MKTKITVLCKTIKICDSLYQKSKIKNDFPLVENNRGLQLAQPPCL